MREGLSARKGRQARKTILDLFLGLSWLIRRMTESLSLFTVFSALDETYVTDIGVPIDRQFRPMPSYKRQQRPGFFVWLLWTMAT